MGSVQSNESLKRKNFFQLSERGDGRRRSRDLTHQREPCHFEGGGRWGNEPRMAALSRNWDWSLADSQQHNRALLLNFKKMNSVNNQNEKKMNFPLITESLNNSA